MSVSDVSGKVIANLATEELSHPNPVFHGDTLFCESEVLEVRPSQSKPDRGIVKVHTRVYKQDNTLVAEFKRTVLIPRKNPGRGESLENPGSRWPIPTQRERPICAAGVPTGPPAWEVALAERGGEAVGNDARNSRRLRFRVVALPRDRNAGASWPASTPRPRCCCGSSMKRAGFLRSWHQPASSRRFATPSIPTFAIKQGCVGGPPRTRRVLRHRGIPRPDPSFDNALLDGVSWERDPDFGYDLPAEVPGPRG